MKGRAQRYAGRLLTSAISGKDGDTGSRLMPAPLSRACVHARPVRPRSETLIMPNVRAANARPHPPLSMSLSSRAEGRGARLHAGKITGPRKAWPSLPDAFLRPRYPGRASCPEKCPRTSRQTPLPPHGPENVRTARKQDTYCLTKPGVRDISCCSLAQHCV